MQGGCRRDGNSASDSPSPCVNRASGPSTQPALPRSPQLLLLSSQRPQRRGVFLVCSTCRVLTRMARPSVMQVLPGPSATHLVRQSVTDRRRRGARPGLCAQGQSHTFGLINKAHANLLRRWAQTKRPRETVIRKGTFGICGLETRRSLRLEFFRNPSKNRQDHERRRAVCLTGPRRP